MKATWAAIRRPDGIVFLELFVGGQLVELLAFDVIEIEQVGPAIGRDDSPRCPS
jgi:hypothetical protein